MHKVLVPASSIISLADAKTHLRIDAGMDAEDALISALIDAAHEYAESYTGRAIGSQTIQAIYPSISPTLTLPKGPARSIISITGHDTSGAPTVIPPNCYTFNDYSTDQQVYFHGQTNADPQRPIQITYLAGDLPKTVRAALLLTVGHLYANREAVADARLASIPLGTHALLDTVRVYNA
jgi:uncharacterized phiE125 gp8 family phage protein